MIVTFIIIALVIVDVAVLFATYHAGYRKGEADTNIRRNRIPDWRK